MNRISEMKQIRIIKEREREKKTSQQKLFLLLFLVQ